MRKSELKALLKPLIKECIRESILEEGVLSSIIMEVTKGLRTAPIVEQKRYEKTNTQTTTPAPSVNERLTEHRKKLMSAIDPAAYGGIDLFEGTTPVPGQGSSPGNPLGGMDSHDAGIDISGLMEVGGKKWKSLM